MGIAEVRQMKQKIEQLKDDFQKEMESSFEGALAEIMNTYDIKNIVIRSYTASFNDGDAIFPETDFIFSFRMAENHGLFDQELEKDDCTIDMDDDAAIKAFEEEFKIRFPELDSKNEQEIQDTLSLFHDYLTAEYNNVQLTITPKEIKDGKVLSVDIDVEDYDCGH